MFLSKRTMHCPNRIFRLPRSLLNTKIKEIQNFSPRIDTTNINWRGSKVLGSFILTKWSYDNLDGLKVSYENIM
eukprot:snap_masked-scaffold_29-processed-gene-1.30-mRNA-1 protein AED:1.00 eAED:1.00 QI:0/0/0/0/1/1/3/0/73